jgi:cytochrome c oxidase assembly protein subunit 15
MDIAHRFTVLRPLGVGSNGEPIPFAALTAIHMVHRIGAAVVFVAIGILAWRLWHAGAAARRWALALAGVAAWQLASGLGNVVLGWPLAAAVAHTGGAAALITLLSLMLARVHRTQRATGDAPARHTLASGLPTAAS